MNTLEKFEKEHLKELQSEKNIPEFSSGDTIKVHLKVKEGEKERIQVFEGVCISKKNSGINSAFTVRKISYGEGIHLKLVKLRLLRQEVSEDPSFIISGKEVESRQELQKKIF